MGIVQTIPVPNQRDNEKRKSSYESGLASTLASRSYIIYVFLQNLQNILFRFGTPIIEPLFHARIFWYVGTVLDCQTSVPEKKEKKCSSLLTGFPNIDNVPLSVSRQTLTLEDRKMSENTTSARTYTKMVETTFGQLSASVLELHKKITKLRKDGRIQEAIEEAKTLHNTTRHLRERLILDEQMADTFGVSFPIGTIVSGNDHRFVKLSAHRNAADTVWCDVKAVSAPYVIVHRASERLSSDQVSARIGENHEVSEGMTVAEI